MKSESKTEPKSEIVNNSWIEQAEPILSGLMSGWRLIPVDMKSHEVSRILHMECGIDYLLSSESEVYGVSVKVQYGKNYRTFTLPKDSQIGTKATGTISPYYTMQVYIDNGRIIGLGLVKTADLKSFIERGFAMEIKTREGKFYVCDWDDLRLAGYVVKECRIERLTPEGKKACHGAKLEDLMCDIDDDDDDDDDNDDDDECDECDKYDIRDIFDIVAQALGKKKMAYVPF